MDEMITLLIFTSSIAQALSEKSLGIKKAHLRILQKLQSGI